MSNIAKAFVKAQKEFGPALKKAVNPHFKNRYATLENVVDAVSDALNNNGIALQQLTHECDNGVIVETIFLHESGEVLSGGKLKVPSSKADAQGFGSALSYARRYSLLAACGIASEDDDGQAACTPSKPTPAVTQDSPFTLQQLSVVCDKLGLSKEWRVENRNALLQFLDGCAPAKLEDKVQQFLKR